MEFYVLKLTREQLETLGVLLTSARIPASFSRRVADLQAVVCEAHENPRVEVEVLVEE